MKHAPLLGEVAAPESLYFSVFPRPRLYSITVHSGQSEGGWEVRQPIRGEEADDTAISDIMTTVNIGHLPVMESVFYGRKAQLPCIFCLHSSLAVFVITFCLIEEKYTKRHFY